MLGVVDLGPMRRYFRVNRADWVFSMGAMLGILFFGIIQGILIGVVLSLLLLIARSSKPGVRRLGRDPTSGVCVDLDRYRRIEAIPGVLVLRLDGPLFFADANRFRDALNEMIEGDSGTGPGGRGGRRRDLADRHRRRRHGGPARRGAALARVWLALARVEPETLELWTRAGAIDAVGPDHVFETVRAAVQALDPRPPRQPRPPLLHDGRTPPAGSASGSGSPRSRFGGPAGGLGEAAVETVGGGAHPSSSWVLSHVDDAHRPAWH